MAGLSGAASRPTSRGPARPPIRCTPTTSSESSKPSLNFSPTASAHSTPAIAPIAKAPTALTDEHDGVMATNPATMPDAPPSVVAWPSRIRSVSSQKSMAVAVAIVVVMNVEPATPLELVAEPALNPYQPNHSRPAPSITNGTLCGRNSVVGQPLRLPRTIASTKPAVPELIWTAVPPAKSIACSLLAIQPPCSAAKPSNANTQCATGKYTNVAHNPANTSQALNLRRSETAPEINATVMIANISWNATNTVAGSVPASGISVAATPLVGSAATELPPIRPFRPQYSVGSPTTLPLSFPNAIE